MKIRSITVLLIALLAPSLYAQSKVQSYYTALDQPSCLLTAHHQWDHEGMDYYTMECPAIGGYQIRVHDMDQRTWIELRKGTYRREYLREMIDANLGAFPQVGMGKLEWRVRIQNGEATPLGLIFRVTAIRNLSTLARISKLFVVRLGTEGSCFIGMTDDNARARQMLDTNPGCSAE